MSHDAPQVAALDHLVLTVADVGETAAFYRDVLGMGVGTFRAGDGTDRTALTFGAQKINLHEATAPFAPHAARPGPGTADLCFLTGMPLEVWSAHLAARGVLVEAGPVTRTGATGPIASLYLRDPDGNLIEIAVPA